MKTPKFSHKTPHLKGKQHQLDPNLDLKQLVHHSTVQYVDRDADGDVDVFDNPKKKIPDENPVSINVQPASKKLISKQKGEIKHTKVGMAYEESKKCKSGYYYCFTNKECKPIPAGFMIDPAGMLVKETGASIDEEGLRDWFGKSRSKDGKAGWVNVVTGGTCASDEPGEGTPKCVSSAKRASMTPAERRAAARRKKAADPGQQQKTGAAKPTYVPTDSPKKKMKEERDHEYSMARSELSTIVNAAKRLQKKMAKGEGNVEAWVQSKITKAADYLDSAADYVDSGEMNKEEIVLEVKDSKGKSSGQKDACYHKVKSRYRVWPSAYASGALVKCRKVGADSWGNKSEGFSPVQMKVLEELGLVTLNEKGQKCWPGYEKKGTQTLFGKTYNRCVKKEEQDPCNHTHKGDECPVHGKKECPSMVDEAVRIPAKTGNIILVTLNWRGKYYMMKMFFPQTTKPNRNEVQDQIEKVYPGAKVQSYQISDIKPGEQFLQTNEYVGGSAASPGPSKKYVKPYGEQVEYVEVEEDWQSVNRKDRTAGLSQAAVNAYRRENPGSKLQTAVTEKNPTGKRASRRKSFCRRMKGMKSKLTSAKTARDPDSNINKALRRWNCN